MILDRSIRPEYKFINSIQISDLISTKLRNNIPLFYNIDESNQLIKLVILNTFGYEKANNFAIPYMTSKLLLEGTQKHNNKELFDIIEFNGASLDISTYADNSVLSLTVLKSNFANILPLINELFTCPSFPSDRLAHIKTLENEEILIDESDIKYLSYKELKKQLFGEKHKYGWTKNRQDIDNIKTSDIESCFDKYWNNDVQMILCGNVDDQVINLINDNIQFNIISSDKNNESKHINEVVDNKKTYIAKEDSQQTCICIGKKTISPNHSDFHKLWNVISFLGGYFGSRLMMNIREDKGYTYGIRASLVSLLDESYIVIKTSAKKGYHELICDEINKEIYKLQNEYVSDEELSSFKQFFTGEMLNMISVPFSIVSQYYNILSKHLSTSYYMDRFNSIVDLTKDDILNISRQYLNDFKTVIIG